MTPQKKIKALAELDGKPEPHSPSPEEVSSGSYYQWEPAYLASLKSQSWTFDATPTQLADALLIATGKMKE